MAENWRELGRLDASDEGPLRIEIAVDVRRAILILEFGAKQVRNIAMDADNAEGFALAILDQVKALRRELDRTAQQNTPRA